jgi:hypothetical protein
MADVIDEHKIRIFPSKHVSSVVNACGHKLSPIGPPSNNCDACWFAYFSVCADIGEIHQSLVDTGYMNFVSKYGKKYVKHFKKYLHEVLTKGNDAQTQGSGNYNATDLTQFQRREVPEINEVE